LIFILIRYRSVREIRALEVHRRLRIIDRKREVEQDVGPQPEAIHNGPRDPEHERRGPAHGPGEKTGVPLVPAQLEHVE
jgi:hypothetical protein